MAHRACVRAALRQVQAFVMEAGSRSRNCKRLCLAVLLVASGCSTYDRRIGGVRTSFFLGDLAQAEVTLDKSLKHPGNDGDVLKLERAIIDLADGKPKEAERALREVRDRFDYLEQKSLAESALSMLTDDQRKAYSGEDYEKVLIRAFLALSNLMCDGQDAGAYALQVADKQQQVVQAALDKQGQNPKASYKQVAVGAYVNSLIREETHANFDDVARYSAMVVSWQPDFAYGRQDLERAQRGRHSAPGNGVLYVFTLVGRGPYKEETIEIPSTAALLIAGAVLSNNTRHTLPPNIAPIKVPKVVVPGSQIRNVGVAVDRQPAGMTETITDVSRMAAEQYAAVYPHVLANAIVRRVVKKGIIYGAKEVLGTKNDSLANVAFDVAGIAWEATEAADTRCWSLLPDKIQVLRLELPAGEHQIALQPLGFYGPLGRQELQTVTIVNGRNTYAMANFPDARLVGKILTNQR